MFSGAFWEGEGDAGERDEGEGGEEGHRVGKGKAGQNPAEDLNNRLKKSKEAENFNEWAEKRKTC